MSRKDTAPATAARATSAPTEIRRAPAVVVTSGGYRQTRSIGSEVAEQRGQCQLRLPGEPGLADQDRRSRDHGGLLRRIALHLASSCTRSTPPPPCFLAPPLGADGPCSPSRSSSSPAPPARPRPARPRARAPPRSFACSTPRVRTTARRPYGPIAGSRARPRPTPATWSPTAT